MAQISDRWESHMYVGPPSIRRTKVSHPKVHQVGWVFSCFHNSIIRLYNWHTLRNSPNICTGCRAPPYAIVYHTVLYVICVNIALLP